MCGRTERFPDRLRPMGMSASVRMGVTLLACGLLAACASSAEGGDRDCVSFYDAVATAPTWHELEDAMVANHEWGRVVSVRTQARGDEVRSPSGEHVVRVVDLLDRQGRR